MSHITRSLQQARDGTSDWNDALLTLRWARQYLQRRFVGTQWYA